MNRTLRQAKTIKGEIEVPSSYREVLNLSLPAIFASGETILKSVPRCNGTEALFAFLSRTFNSVTRENNCFIIKGCNGFSSPSLPPEINAEDVPDVVERLVPFFFSRGVRIVCRKQALSSRFINTLKKLDAAGFMVTRTQDDDKIILELTTSSPDSVTIEMDCPDENVKAACVSGLVTAATGVNKIIEATPLPGDFENALKKMGADIQISRSGKEMTIDSPDDEGPKDELEKRIRRLQAKKDPSSERPSRIITIKECGQLKGTTFDFGGDLLLAAPFILAATLLNNSNIKVTNMGGSALSGLLVALRRMGALLKSERSKDTDTYTLEIESAKLSGRRVSGELSAGLGEMFPFVAVAAAYAQGQSVIRDVLFLHDAPVDLIEGTISNLKAMGVKVGEIEDGIVIEGAKEYDGAEFDSFGNPILALAFSAAAIKNKGESIIKNAEAVDFIWPDFYFKLESLLNTGN